MTTTDMQSTILKLVQEVGRLTDLLSPWVSPDEMCKRYDVTQQTLRAMERDGRLPTRHAGRWSRSELLQWETRRST